MTDSIEAGAMPPLTAEAVIAAATGGEAAAWDWIFDRYHAVVSRYARARLSSMEDAEEVAQDVFVAAVSSLGRVRERTEAGLESWLIGITRNKVTDRIRANTRVPREGLHDDRVADPSALAGERLDASELRVALDRLTDDQRDVVIRRFLLDQSLEQVAAATGRPPGAVKSLQHRALAALERQLGPGRAAMSMAEGSP